MLPDSESLSKKRLLEAVLRSAPNTRSRKRYCLAAGALARFAELDCDFSEFAGSYSTRKTEPRDIPTDAAIARFYQSLKDKPTWQYAYGLIACYGLRNHEVFLLDLESIKKPPGILTVTAGKTGARRVYPIYPEWWERWELYEVRDLPLVSGNSNGDLGQRVSQFFRRNALGKPYNLRHAWAIRSMLFGLPVELASAQMGHGVREHCETYHHWINERHHAQAFDLLMTNPNRPTAPS